jgi:hypothetical protein
MNQHALINAGLFQVAWFAAVLGGSLAACVAFALLLWHAAGRGKARADCTIAAICAALGLGLDTTWIYLAVLDFHGAVVAPPWIVVLWAALGVSLNHSLSFLVARPWLGAMLTALAAPFSYWAGAALGGVVIANDAWLAVIAVAWFVVFYVLFKRVVPIINHFWEVEDAAGN